MRTSFMHKEYAVKDFAGFALCVLLFGVVMLQLSHWGQYPIDKVRVMMPDRAYTMDGLSGWAGGYLTHLQMLGFAGIIMIACYLESQKRYSVQLHYCVVGLVMVGAFFAVLSIPLGTGDIYYYIAYGRKLGILGLDPYLPLNEALFDPLIQQAGDYWMHIPANYGPSAILLFAALNFMAVPEMSSLLLVFKLFWLLVFFAFMAISYRLFQSKGEYPATRWLLLCANPVTWRLLLSDTHMEMLIITVAALCLMAAYRQAWLTLGLLLGVISSIKLIMLVLVPFFVWYALRKREEDSWRPGILRALKVGGLFLAYILPLYVYFKGADILPLIEFSAKYNAMPQIIPDAINHLLQFPLMVQFFHNDYAYVKLLSNLTLLIGLIALFGHFALSRRPQSLPMAMASAMLLLLFTLTWCHPWYILWSAFFLIAGAAERRGVLLAGAFYSLYGFSNYASVHFIFALLVSLGLYSFWKLWNDLSRVPEHHTS